MRTQVITEPEVEPVEVVVVEDDLPAAIDALWSMPTAGGLRMPDGLDLSPLIDLEPGRMRALLFEGALDPRVAVRFPELQIVEAATCSRYDLRAIGESGASLRVLRTTKGGDVGDLSVFAQAPAYEALHVLHLVDPCVDDDGLRAYFSDSDRARHLRSLVLTNRSVRGRVRGMQGRGVYCIGAAPLVALESLSLAYQRLDSVYPLTTSQSVHDRLRHLDLAGTGVGSSVDYLRQAGMPLESLDLHGLYVRAYSLESMLGGELAKTLRDLRMSAIGDQGAQVLAKLGLRLDALRLDCAELTTLDGLLAAEWIGGVRTLDLAWNFLDDRALGKLALDGLEQLRLAGNPVSFAAVRALVDRCPGLTMLEADLDEAERLELAKARPSLELAAPSQEAATTPGGTLSG